MTRWIFIFAVLLATHAQAATYYVATTGNDTAAGSSTAPWRSVTHAVNAMSGGDILRIRPGTYAEELPTIPNGLDDAHRTIIQADDPLQRPRLRPVGTFRVATLSRTAFVTLDGLIMDGTAVTIDALKITDGAHHITIQRCQIGWAPEQGILVTETATHDVVLSANEVLANGHSTLHHGIYTSVAGTVIVGNDIHGNYGYGIHVYHSGLGGTDGVVVRDNWVHNQQTRPGIIIADGDLIRVEHNRVTDNPVAGIEVGWERSTRAQITDNTVSGSPVGIWIFAEATGALVARNIVGANGTPIINDGGAVLEGNILTPLPSAPTGLRIVPGR